MVDVYIKKEELKLIVSMCVGVIHDETRQVIERKTAKHLLEKSSKRLNRYDVLNVRTTTLT